MDLSSTIGIIGSPFFWRAARAQAHPMRDDAARGDNAPKKGHMPFRAISEARRLSIGLMAMAAVGLRYFF
ncbi:hypothetical protein ACVDG5_025795 [Mesorhizobium sp. ORM6]